MNIGENKKKSSPSEDLTVVLIRGNGSPRSFRMSLPALHRSLTALGLLFFLAIFATIVMLGYSLTQRWNEEEGTPAVATSGSGTRIAGEGQPEDASESQKELSGLRHDIARLNAELEGRSNIPSGSSTPLLQLMGPRSSLVPESDSMMRIKNPTMGRDDRSQQILLDFELHNIDPNQRQERGYIVALAKSRDMIASYPTGLFAPQQNILLDFTKGETFAISRFRQARAIFPAVVGEGKGLTYQILLFGTDGKVLANIHVEEPQ